MKVTLYMAMTVNGLIATNNGNSSWVSAEDSQEFIKNAKRVGAMIIGKRTYQVLQKEGGQIDECLTVVMTHDTSLKDTQNTVFTNKSPKEILTMLEKKGFQEAMVAGGGQINSLFMKEGLIDEIYIDIEPLILGSGIPLFNPADFQCRLQLLSTKKLNTHTVQLHYKIMR